METPHGIRHFLRHGQPVAGSARPDHERPRYPLIIAMVGLGWLLAILLTDKYAHKYQQRYITYLLASHAKAALIMATAYLLIRLIAGPGAAPMGLIFTSLLLFVSADLLISVPRRKQAAPRACSIPRLPRPRIQQPMWRELVDGIGQ
jgi:hypothetical protein